MIRRRRTIRWWASSLACFARSGSELCTSTILQPWVVLCSGLLLEPRWMYTCVYWILLLITFLEETCNLNRLHSLMVPFPIAVVELAILFCWKVLWGSCIYDICTHVITCILCKHMILHLCGVHMKYHWCDFVHLELLLESGPTLWATGSRDGLMQVLHWRLASRKRWTELAAWRLKGWVHPAMSNWAWRPWKGDNQNVFNSSLISRSKKIRQAKIKSCDRLFHHKYNWDILFHSLPSL